MNRTDDSRRSARERTVTKQVLIILFIVLLCCGLRMTSQAAESLRLIGMIKSSHFTGIVLSDAKGEQSFYRVSDKLPDGSQIVEVRSDSILLKGADGTSFAMFISHDMNNGRESKTMASVPPGAPLATPAPPSPPPSYASETMQNTKTEQIDSLPKSRGRRILKDAVTGERIPVPNSRTRRIRTPSSADD